MNNCLERSHQRSCKQLQVHVRFKLSLENAVFPSKKGLIENLGLCGAGKLFPGPHLYAGAGIVVLWAAASSLVPAMQKGNETARNTHIALNTLNLALFAWQV